MSDIITLDRDMEGANAINTARLVGQALEDHYPGWLWHVEVSGGVATIRSMHANPKRGYRLNLVRDFYSASDLKRQAVIGGGELLERLNMPRRKADWDVINARPQTANGYLDYAT